MMQYRRLGRTGLQVSAVGFGTCQLRRVPEQQAIDTLKRGFALGVNLVHTAPDYEGADDLVAQAVKESGRDVIVLTQGYGDRAHLEWLFEEACRKFRKRRLQLFGIACIDDREYLGERVWGAGGAIEFLQRKKAEGRIGGTFCTTHGTPEYVARLIESGAFDAIMLAYNALGFHLLSYHPTAPRAFENIPRNKSEIFPLARAHDVGLLIMKPLAGGLLCESKAFPRRAQFGATGGELTAGAVLRDILRHPEVASVVPGTASVEEAEENAHAGFAAEERHAHEPIAVAIDHVKATICSRCGECDSSCSQHLPISWLFRDAYIVHYPGETFETADQLRYFVLHPSETSICATCPNVTCSCPYGIDIPRSLIEIHDRMLARRAERLLPDSAEALGWHRDTDRFAPVIVSREIPQALAPGQRAVCRLYLQNIGSETWKARSVTLDVYIDGTRARTVPIRHDVEPGTRTHLVFDIDGPCSMRLILRGASPIELLQMMIKNLHAALPAYGVEHLGHRIPERLRPGAMALAWVRLRNAGSRTWCRHHPEGHCTDVVVLCDDAVWATHHLPVPDVPPGESVTVHFPLRAPDASGRHKVSIDLVEQGVTLFSGQGVRPLVTTLDVASTPLSSSETLYLEASAISPWHYQPTRGIHVGTDGGSYPLFAARAQGCHLWDLEGRRYIDYVMGWGSALLGYAEPRIRDAVIAAMDCAPVVPLPHRFEIEVSRRIVEDIPCAEMVMFGKNGSDVCTLAARVARVFTGRKTILFSGYHGWGDFWVEHVGFAASGVPDRAVPLIHRFRFNDLADFTRVFERHRHDLAAVMLEPAGPAEAPGRVGGNADADFLGAIAQMTRDAGALLIYDEIMTGFRYPGGSAQRATGVIPDLTCLGKALAAGMPLSALSGRAAVLMRAMGQTHYGPTYRGEVYSLAAARAALDIYRTEPVAEHVWSYGERLRRGIDDLCVELGASARMTGPPFRMGLVFNGEDPRRITLQRTLFHQELLKAGVITYDGLMLPSYAHDDAALAETLVAMRQALAIVTRATREDALDRYLEIPII